MIIVGGENLIDMVPLKAAAADCFQALPGGSPYNCARALGRQGQATGYLTPLSTDSLGDLLAETLRASGVKLLSERRCEPTSLAVASLQDGVATYQFYRTGTAERMVSSDGLIACTPQNATALHLGSLTLSGGLDADIWADYYCRMHQHGLFCALDPNIRAPFIADRARYLARLDKILAHTDLLKLSDEDLSWLYPGAGSLTAAGLLAEKSSAKILVVTLGAKGAFALAGGSPIHVKAAPVAKLRDTIGAGDTFMATLLAHLARNNTLTAGGIQKMDRQGISDLLVWATQAAALNCAETGCNPPDYFALKASHLAQS